jgi:hypothetical protein
MTQQDKGPGRFVEKVREETQRYMLDLLEDNERLRRRLAGLESERTRLREEKMTLQEQQLTLREELDRFQEEQLHLQQQLTEVEAENHRFSARYVEVEEQNNNLANLYVASYRLHETVNRDEVLTALQEIIINLIGSEDFVVFERDGEGGGLAVTAAFGVGQERIAELDLDSGPISQTARTGEMYVADGDSGGRGSLDSGLVACIPMKLAHEVHGVIAIFQLLSHKDGLEPLDLELFDLLASHAASSLFVSHLHDEVEAEGGAVA